jgi:hypothetical protein
MCGILLSSSWAKGNIMNVWCMHYVIHNISKGTYMMSSSGKELCRKAQDRQAGNVCHIIYLLKCENMYLTLVVLCCWVHFLLYLGFSLFK